MRSLSRVAAIVVLAFSAAPPESGMSAQSSPRERLSIDEHWRFTKGDPPGNDVSLLYDVRPEVRDERDDRPADAEPRPSVRVDAPVQTIKAWILPGLRAGVTDITSAAGRR